MPTSVPLLIIISGPAGSGKTTLCDTLLDSWASAFPESPTPLERVITATTREPREGETDGVDYFFLSPEAFQSRVQAGGFFEHARVFQNRYGILKEEIYSKLDHGTHLLINIDVQGAHTLRKNASQDPRMGGRLFSVFILPPDKTELEARLRGRGQNDESDLQHRLAIAEKEMEEWVHYDYSIVSSSREADFQKLLSIIRAEQLRVRARAPG